MAKVAKVNSVNSPAEDIFVNLFYEVFGPDKAENLYVQYPAVDIYGNHRYIDFALKNEDAKIAIEIDGETYHNPKNISPDKYYDDLLKQNSLIYNNWRVYRWAYNQLIHTPDKVKDELQTFLGQTPFLKEFEEFLPRQNGKVIELRDYQKDAIDNLKQMRENGETIALLYHATGVGKTVTAVSDAKAVGGRTLFLVNKLNLADQAESAFQSIWPEAKTGYYTGEEKSPDAYILLATVQSISRGLTEFLPNSFDYIIIDECHHSAAQTYQKILSYFKPKFILGLSATPERSDGNDMLEMFQNVAHKMDLQTAVEKEILAPVRCMRVKTNIDLSNVRINGIQYNSQDLESKLFLPERNFLIAETCVEYAADKKSVIFCASVNHAKEIARLLEEKGLKARSVSGQDKPKVRKEILEEYENGDICALCACDLLNEGWDSPKTEVLFMARPTMSKTVYLQQLGRGMRKSEGKGDLLIFDFVDNANMFNMSYSLHRLLNIAEYRPFEYTLAPKHLKELDKNLFRKGEKPSAYMDMPFSIDDLEVIDLFNWQTQSKDMISQIEFVRMVDVQSETVEKYIREEKIISDLAVPIGNSRVFHYFYEDTISKYAKQFGWDLITYSNIKDKFIQFVEKMDMSYSYKPVLLKAIFENMNAEGVCAISDIVDYFIEFYDKRKEKGEFVEKPNSLFAKESYTRKDAERTIMSNPFKRFADMRFLKRCKDLEYIEINPIVFKRLSKSEFGGMIRVCDGKLLGYYGNTNKK